MHVFILTLSDYEDKTLLGVYSSLSLAQNQCPVTTEWEPIDDWSFSQGKSVRIPRDDETADTWYGLDKDSGKTTKTCISYPTSYHIYKFELDHDTD